MKPYPVAENFHSVQGEGRWTGTPMHFIRLAGCSVGKPQQTLTQGPGDFPILKTGKPAWLCHTYDNRPFWCDTDFNKYKEMSIEDILSETYEEHICLTGGEPLIHDLLPIINVFRSQGTIHVETSGTIHPEWLNYRTLRNPWITVSPKKDVLASVVECAAELKLLVDGSFDIGKVPLFILKHPEVYVQPINEELKINRDNLQLCLDLLRENPTWKLSVQMHKLIGVR